MEGYLRQLFDERKVSPENRQKLWQYYYGELSKGIDAGYSPSPEMYDPALAHSLKYDVARFSAFKETSFRKQLETELTKNGKVVPWSEFKKKADELGVEYNRRWLKTEYHQTVASANMAQKWGEYEADADLYPNLKIVTAGDGRVRDEHRALDGVTLPVKDPFWKKHTPPFDWGCRCHLVQTDEPADKKAPDFAFKKSFENNPALSGKVFGEIPYQQGVDTAEIKEAESAAKRNFENTVFKRNTLKAYKGGGKIESSNLVDTSEKDYAAILKCCDYFAKAGKTAEILPTVNIKSPLYKELFGDLIGTKYEGKCPDFSVDGLLYELEGFDGKGSYSAMLKRGLKQSSRIVISQTGETDSHLKKLIKFAIHDGKKVDEVWVYDNGKLRRFYPH